MRACWIFIAIALLAPSHARCQGALFLFEGPPGTTGFGLSVANAGDTDGDGIEDMVVGLPGDSPNGDTSGSARVYSGKDGRLLHVFLGEDKNDALGREVGGGGDVNADGFDDVVLGVPFDFVFDRGSVRVHSGKDGSLLHKLTGVAAGDAFGWSVDVHGDVDGDGYADVLVGAPGTDVGGSDYGTLYVFSGATGLLLYQIDGNRVGGSAAFAGDVNGDGVDDIVAGSPFTGAPLDPPGRAFVFSGVDGALLLTLEGSWPNGKFGDAVSGTGDVDGDGKADVIVGAPADGTNGQQSGRATVFSGADGGAIHTLLGETSSTTLGTSVSAAGDLDGDGHGDVLVGVLDGGDGGEIRAYSGLDGALLHSFTSGQPHDDLGLTCDSLQDLDGDGVREAIAGAWRADTSNGPDTGAAWVFTVQDPGTSFCGPANLNSSGQPAVIHAFGSRVVVLNDLRLEATDTAVDQFGMFLNSQATGFTTPPGSQGNLCLSGGIGRYKDDIQSTGFAGEMSLQLDLTDTPTPSGPVAIQPGETWYFQAWFRDKNPGPTSNFTDGLEITFH